MAIEVIAPAKINLTLHVTDQRDDGYHLLDSLVVFAPVCDRLRIETNANGLSLTVDGPEADGCPADMSNLVLKAAALLTDKAAITLQKNLPIASGVGGGSADAAATLRALVSQKLAETDANELQLWQLLSARADEIAALGADIPMCLPCEPVRAQGIGDEFHRVSCPPLPAVLVNPRQPVSTPQVFKALESKNNPPMPDELPAFSDAASVISFLRDMRNDLEPPARLVEPAIDEVLSALQAQAGCGLARMSGSGATCFGLFEHKDEAMAAAQALSRAKPDWWVAGCVLGDQARDALPRVS